MNAQNLVAEVAELADALGSGPSGLTMPVEVQVLSSAPGSVRGCVEQAQPLILALRGSWQQFGNTLGVALGSSNGESAGTQRLVSRNLPAPRAVLIRSSGQGVRRGGQDQRGACR